MGMETADTDEGLDATGGWLRPAIFGAMDGLVSNFSLAMGVAGGSDPGSTKPVIVAGLAGLAAGAFSMAAGEYTSVASQAEFSEALVERERQQILADDVAEQEQLAGFFEDKGITVEESRKAAAQVHEDLDDAVRVHSLEEYGVDLDNLPNPWLAAVSSFFSFAVGAALPILPYVLGADVAWPAIVVSLLALFACGAIVTRVTNRSWWYGGLRQLVLGAAAAGLTYLVGTAVGGQSL